MKARDYLEHSFIPWILFLDAKDTINHFLNGKEEFLCETYNHIMHEFKSIDYYELYMFRVQSTKIMIPTGMIDLIICKLPPVRNPKDACYMLIAYNQDQLIYYTVDLVIDTTYQIKRFKKGQQEVISTTNNEYNNVMNIIQNDLFMI